MARMRLNKRAVALVVALALAGVATVALWSWLDSREAEALQGTEAVDAFVATDVIPAGTRAQAAIDQGLIGREAVARRFLLEGAIGSLTQLQPNSVAAVTIQPGEQILASRFVQAGALQQQGGTASLDIPEDRQAITVQVGIPPGVANFPVPGSRVSVIAQLDVTSPQAGTRVEFLVQNAIVLSNGRRVVTRTDQGTTEQIQQPAEQVLLTLAVTPEDAEQIAYAVFQGQIYFTLLPAGLDDYPEVDTPGRTSDNAFQ